MKNILLVLISFVIISCSNAVSAVTKTVELFSVEDSDAINFTEAKAYAIYYLGFIGHFGNTQIIKAIQDNKIKKVYAVDRYYSNYFFV